MSSFAGMPFGCAVQPLTGDLATTGPLIASKDIARCETCFGYINPFVVFDRKR